MGGTASVGGGLDCCRSTGSGYSPLQLAKRAVNWLHPHTHTHTSHITAYHTGVRYGHDAATVVHTVAVLCSATGLRAPCRRTCTWQAARHTKPWSRRSHCTRSQAGLSTPQRREACKTPACSGHRQLAGQTSSTGRRWRQSSHPQHQPATRRPHATKVLAALDGLCRNGLRISCGISRGTSCTVLHSLLRASGPSTHGIQRAESNHGNTLPSACHGAAHSVSASHTVIVRACRRETRRCACLYNTKRPAALRLSSRHKGGAKGLAQRSKACTQLLCLDVNETSRSCPQDSSRQPSNGRVTDREPGDTPSRGRELTKGSNTRQRCVAGPSDNRTQGGENQLPCQHARTFYSLQQRRTQKNTPHTRTKQHQVSYRSNETRLRVLQTQHGRHSGAHKTGQQFHATHGETAGGTGGARWSHLWIAVRCQRTP